MNKLKSDNLSIIINIQYGTGFELTEGKVEIETTILDETKKTRIVSANRNRINFFEEFIWKIDKAKLKQCRTCNEVTKIECFTTSDLCYGRIYRRQRLGHLLIRLKEFQIIGRDWDQKVSVRSYKLQGTNNYYELRIILIIQEDDLENTITCKKSLEINNKEQYFKAEKYSLGVDKKGEDNSIKNMNATRCSTYQENTKINKLQREKNNKINQTNEKETNKYVKQDIELQDTLDKCEDIINNLNTENKQQKVWKMGIHNKLNKVKKKIEQSVLENKGSLKLNESNDCKLSELLATSLKHTEELLKIMREIKIDFDTNNMQKYSSCLSSVESDIVLERPITLMDEMKNKLNELAKYMIHINKRIKNNETKRSREISNLKSTNCILSELCDTIGKKISEV